MPAETRANQSNGLPVNTLQDVTQNTPEVGDLTIEVLEPQIRDTNLEPSIFFTDIIGRAGDMSANVIWNMPELTEEQNEQLGLRNLFLLLIKYSEDFTAVVPDILENPDNETQDKAKKIILGICGTYEKFIEVFGSKSLIRDNTPYFEGSHIIALKKLLKQFNIVCKIQDFPFPKNFWIEQTYEEAISTLQTIFVEAYPDANLLLSEDQITGSDEGNKIALEYVLEKIGGKEKFAAVFTTSVVDTRKCPHFDGSTNKTLKALLTSWKIKFTSRNFRDRGNMYGGKTEAECIDIMQKLWREKIPEFDLLFPQDESGQIAEDLKQSAEEFITNRVGSTEGFDTVFGGSPRVKKFVPHFEGSLSIALQKTFESFGIQVAGNRREPNYWTVERMEQRALALFREHGRFNGTLLDEIDDAGFKNAISKRYAGGMPTLIQRTRLVLETEGYSFTEPYSPIVRLPRGHWNVGNFQQEALAIYREHGAFTPTFLEKIGRKSFMLTVYTKYPGKFHSLQEWLNTQHSEISTISSEEADRIMAEEMGWK